jgi:site-specific DNA-cytosine methylase
LEDLGYEVLNLDNRKECQATFTVDIRDWDYKKVCNPGEFALIFASIPCTEFSQALTTRERDLSTADAIAKKTLEIIEWLKPEKYFIENPAGGSLLRKRPYMQGIPRIRVDYCQFQPKWGYKKPTFIFGSVQQLTDRVCDRLTCSAMMPGKNRHKIWLGGMRCPITRNMKYRVPKALIEYLCTQKEPERENPTHDEIATRRWILKRDSESLTQNKEMIDSQSDERQKNCRKETWRTKQKSSKSVQQLYMRHLCKYLDQEVGKAKVRGNDTQLLLRVNVKTPEGETKQLLALVDTGAQVNLYRTGLFDECQTKPAKKPLSLVTVDGTRLSGGQREIWLQVEFFATSEKQKMGWQEDACFLEGDIQVDLILGYPWLRTVQLGILPHKDALF